ncbi:MAG: hypothetical protein QM669_03155 [Siphonobacter sp.]
MIALRSLLFSFFVLFCLTFGYAQRPLSINGFTQWLTGHDGKTEQLFPVNTRDALLTEKGKVWAQVKFNVAVYGELSFPINPNTPEGAEALKVDLSKSRYLKVQYQSNQSVVLQLRQTGIHGGVHNQVILPASKKMKIQKIYFSEFTGGKTPLDLSDVARFNFAFLANPVGQAFAELQVNSFKIDRYRPVLFKN